MKIDVDKKALIDLVCGTSPNYDLFENPTVKKCGEFNGSVGVWSWDRYKLKELSESQLYVWVVFFLSLVLFP